MPILNYTTTVSVEKTVEQITKMLVQHGAHKLITDYDAQKLAINLTFHLEVKPDVVIAYSLPCNWSGVLEAMKRDKKVPRSHCNQAHAIQVGWRILKDWLESQLALLEARLVTPHQVLLPYAVLKNGQTFYQHVEQNPQLLLTAAADR